MQPLTILKIGGNVLENSSLLTRTLERFAQQEGYKILVHGGGRKADQLCKQLGITPQMLNGRRITDAATLDVVTMVYAGLTNKNVVAQLQTLGCNAIGLSGADMNTIQAHKRIVKDVDYGFAGDIDGINTNAIQQLLAAGATPVFCAITHDGKGQLLNTNADTIASTLATHLAHLYSVSLQFCFEKDGVLLNPNDDTSVILAMTVEDYERYKTAGVISGGMLPKLDNAFQAISKGVKEVVIGSVESLYKNTATRLS